MFGQENIYPPVYKVVLVRERHGPSYVVHGAKAAAKVFATFFVDSTGRASRSPFSTPNSSSLESTWYPWDRSIKRSSGLLKSSSRRFSPMQQTSFWGTHTSQETQSRLWRTEYSRIRHFRQNEIFC